MPPRRKGGPPHTTNMRKRQRSAFCVPASVYMAFAVAGRAPCYPPSHHIFPPVPFKLPPCLLRFLSFPFSIFQFGRPERRAGQPVEKIKLKQRQHRLKQKQQYAKNKCLFYKILSALPLLIGGIVARVGNFSFFLCFFTLSLFVS